LAIHIPLHSSRERELPVQVERVQHFMQDIPGAVRMFPALRRLVELGPDTYRWELEPLGTAVYKVPITFATRFSVDLAARRVTWQPVPEVGNARLAGALAFAAAAAGTRFSLRVEGRIILPLPFVLKPVAAPVVASEFERLVEGFAANILRAVG
jgi:hypothetical protein